MLDARASCIRTRLDIGLALWALAAGGCGRATSEPATAPDVPGDTTALVRGCKRVDLAADLPIARRVDGDLVDPWGIAVGRGGLVIANQETGKLSIFDDAGEPGLEGELRSGELAIDDGLTGVAATHGEGFLLAADDTDYPARFIVASLHGHLIAMVPDVTPPIIATVAHEDAMYTGVAVAGDRILAANFKAARIDIFDSTFARRSEAVSPSVDAAVFRDPELPADFAPFNIAVFDQRVFVTYAKQRDGADETGEGLGIVSEFDRAGVFARRLATAGVLDAPWGLAMAPAGFCNHPRPTLLVGNHGSGTIVPIDLDHARALGPIAEGGEPIAIDGLWGLTFGDGHVGSTRELYFTAGFDREEHGLFGRVETIE